MQFKINRSALQREMNFVQGVVEKKKIIPALTNILIESVGESAVRITATDLDVTIRCQVEAQIIHPGSACIEARKLFEITRLLPDEEVHFRCDEHDRSTITCQNYIAKIAGLPRSSYPEVAEARQPILHLPAAQLKRLIDSTIFAITPEESRYTLSGAKLMASHAGVRMITTDGHRLCYIERGEVGREQILIDTIVPKKTLAELAKLTAGFEGTIGIGYGSKDQGGDLLSFEIGPRLLISRALAGQFPNYELVIPKNQPYEIRFERENLVRALRRVSLLSDERSRSIRMEIKSGQIKIDASAEEEGEATETIPAEYTGDEFPIGLNSTYLQEALQALGEDRISLRWKDATSQVLLEPAVAVEGENFQAVIMPLRL